MRRRINAGGKTAGHRQARDRQRLGEVEGVVAPTRTRRAAADHRHRRVPEAGGIAGHEQRQRRAGDAAQQCRVVGVVPTEQVVAGCGQPRTAARQRGGIGLLQGLDLSLVQGVAAPIARSGRECGTRRGVGVQQAST